MGITPILLAAECRHFVIFTTQDNDDRPEPASAAIDRFPTTQSSDREHFLRTRRRGDVPVMRHLSHRKITDAPAHDIALFPRFFQCCEDLPGSLIYSLPPLITRAGSKRVLRKTGRDLTPKSHVFTFFSVILFLLYTLSGRREREQAPLMALPPRSSRVKDARSLSQKRPKKIYGNLSLFSHQPQSKKDAFRHPFIHPCWDVSSYTSDATHSRRSAEGTAG